MGFEGLVGLFEQTQATMQSQAARSVDIALVVRNWLFGWYIVEYQQNESIASSGWLFNSFFPSNTVV